MSIIVFVGQQGPPGPPGSDSTLVIVNSSGTITAQNSTAYFVNLHAAGGNVAFNTSSLISGNSFSVYVIDPAGEGTGGYSCTVDPITAGDHIDAIYPPSGPSAPGTLTSSLVMSAVGQGVSLVTPDGTNLWMNQA